MHTATTHIIACDVMKEELLAIAPQHPITFHFVSMGLHRWPDKLREELRSVLAALEGKNRVVLAFGLCGGAVAGLTAPGVPLFIPLAHDCIPLLLGSRYTHEELVRQEKGTYFLSGGWLEGERTVFSEYRRVRDKYGEQKAKRVMATMFDAYRRLLFIHTGHPREAEHLATGRELAGLLGLEFIALPGRDAWLRRVVNGPWDGDSFIAVEPGKAISETDFGVGNTLFALQGI
jgi:uncharacterized protein DUF1638